jgi:ATP-dependent DNA helicase DinG
MSDDPADVDAVVARALLLLSEAVGHLGGETRPGQVVMCETFTRAAVTGDHTAVRAGTGTGKTAAILACAAATGKQTVIATATNTLLDQLADKDLPLFDKVTPGGLSWASLRGRGRYSCLAKLAQVSHRLSRGDQEGLFGDDDEPVSDDKLDAKTVEEIHVVVAAARRGEGNLDRLGFEPDAKLLREVASTPAECPGAKKCSHAADCFAEIALNEAKCAQVVVTNLSLLAADIATDFAVLGEREIVIIDEAHAAEDILASGFGVELSPGKLRGAAGAARSARLGSGICGSLLLAADVFEQALSELDGARFRQAPNKHPLMGDVLAQCDAATGAALASLRQYRDEVKKASPVLRANKMLTDLADTISMIGDHPGHDACWVDGRSLRRVPVNIGGLLASRAWPDRTVLVTSATLPPATGNRLGLGAAPWLDVGSPFDHAARSALYVPRLPEPKDPGWIDQAWTEARALIEAAGGRTLMLCTSNRNLEAFYDAAKRDLPFPVMRQGEASKSELVRAFAADPSTCLFATASFFQGVDVPGESLSVVIVDKVPWRPPNDPLWQAKREAAGAEGRQLGWFPPVDIPYAATQLAQAAGRLIRSAACSGVICILDSRLAEKSYRNQILGELPPATRTRNRADALAFLRLPVPA